MGIAEFEWDAGNRAKCERHGVSIGEIEGLFRRRPKIAPDVKHSLSEERLIAVGRGASGRPLFVAFTIRERAGTRRIRPITARYMHRKESDRYEKTESPAF